MSARFYYCGRCGRRLRAGRDQYVHSKFTGQHYCLAGHCKKKLTPR